MPHFYVPPNNITEKKFRITGPEAHHIVSVLRKKPGDRIQLFDGTGRVYSCEVTETCKNSLCGIILEEKKAMGAIIKINLFQSVPKGERFDWLVEKTVELGVASLTPLMTDRGVVREIPGSKLERWRRLSSQAAQQCMRPDLMEVKDPKKFSEAVGAVQNGHLSIIPWVGEGAVSIKDTLAGNKKTGEINIFIGPEGDFSVTEIELAKKNGVIPVSLGARILRVETAGLVAGILALALSGEYWQA